jgi:hypothetical protein
LEPGAVHDSGKQAAKKKGTARRGAPFNIIASHAEN